MKNLQLLSSMTYLVLLWWRSKNILFSIETQKNLAMQYKSGDQSAKEKLFNHNLRLVVYLNLNRDEKSVNKTIYNLIMAVCRYKKGIRKEHTYTIEDVKDYYMRHKDEMVPSQEKLYLTYFKRHLKEDAHRNKKLITKLILKDIIKERHPEFNEISELNHDEVVALIKHMHFSSNVLNTLLNKIGETERIIMNGQELNHIYRLLNRLNKNVKLSDKPKLMKAQEKEIFSS